MLKEIIVVKNLKKYFNLDNKNKVHAVDGLSFDIFERETLGLVGESGCGKTTVGRCLLRLLEPDDGEVIFKGENILNFSKNEMRKVRKEMQIIFQDPFSALDPRKTVEQLIAEPLIIHKYGNKEEIKEKVYTLLSSVNLDKDIISKYTHELDGGQCQRIGLARAISLNPSFLVCDEPLSALDVSSQAQVMKLMEVFREKYGLTYLLISHDLSVVRKLSQRIAVMYLGLFVELANSDELFNNPLHPYTRALISAIPRLDIDDQTQRIILKGDVPTPINPEQGCRFFKRCYKSFKKCAHISPPLIKIKNNHFVRCHIYN